MARRNRRGQIRYYKGEPVRVLGRGEDPYFADAIEVKALGDSRQWYKGSVMTVPRSEVHARLVRRRRANRGRGSTPYKKNPIGSTILIAAATAAAGALAVYLVNRLTTKPSAPPALVVGGTAPDAISKAAADAAAAVRQAWEQKNNVMEGPTLGVGGDGAYSNGVGLPHGGGGRGHGGGHPHGGGHGGHGHHGGHGRRHGGRGWGWNGGGWVWGENWPSTIVVYACPPGYVWDEFGNCVPIVVS